MNHPIASLPILASCVVIVAVLASCGGNIEPEDYSDLEPEMLDVDKDENAFTFFLKATNHIFKPDSSCDLDELASGRAWDEAKASAIVATNAEAFRWIKRGIACRMFQEPPITNIGYVTEYISPWLTFGRVLIVRSRLQQESGDTEGAIDTAMLTVKFGQRICEHPNSLISYLVGVAIRSTGLEYLLHLAQNEEVSTERLLTLPGELEQVGSLDRGLRRALQWEFQWQDMISLGVASGRLDAYKEAMLLSDEHPPWPLRHFPRYFFDADATRLLFADYFRTAIANLDHPVSEQATSQAEEEVERFRNEGGRLPLHFLRRNSFGKVLFAIMTPAIERIHIHQRHAEVTMQAVRLSCALHAYRRDFAEFPEELGLLVPQFLPDIPLDPFDGRALRYLPDQEVIYSVGENLVDDGGDATEEDATHGSNRIKAPDIVFFCSSSTNHP